MTGTNPYQAPEPALPPPIDTATLGQQSEPSGIGGWLILVGIGIVFSPIRLTAAIFQIYLPIFQNGAWEVLTTPGTEQYNVLWAPLLIFEIVTNIAFVFVYIFLAILFFRRSRFFPRAFIIVSIANLCFILFDAWFGSLVMPDEAILDADTAKEVVRSLISATIWIPYMIFSKRVKNTFLN